MSLDKIRELVKDDLAAYKKAAYEHLQVDISFIDNLSQHIVESGGKRLRPLLVILGAKAANYKGNQHVDLAAAMEFFHTATLLHDDVVDASTLRRGKKTANSIWGNKASILVGDFLFTRSFQIMLQTANLEVYKVIADAAVTISKGEILQMLNCNNPNTSKEEYLEIIKCKTAALFSAAAQMGPILAECPEDEINALATYGLHIGVAFQLIDDTLDYCAETETIGKNIGDDLAEGKPTLPLIQAAKCGSQEQQDIIRHAIEHGCRDNLPLILAAIQSTRALDYTYEIARDQIDNALTALQRVSPSPYRDALVQLAEFSLERHH